ncbi:hypothetical protein [Actinopolymorpha pittospori]|uniref:Uncharacterized protein n=1 Tax=Actinopolymorpha pittospori TaxID=648752 RepID=A0A927R6Q9_9ACTN|nr:hypothetical protein [Actinopolymorpha pittospori]MBE1603394.1 hypothetical protein [Actinopolymorpha pittospori]
MSGAELSGDKKQDRAQIEQAARKIAGRDYPRFKAAVQYAKEYTTLGSHAFGYAASALLASQYRLARDSQVQNLEDGLRRLEELIAGMTEVAYRMSVTEAANTIDLTKVRQVRVGRPVASVTEPAPTGGFGLRAMGTALHLLPTWQVPAALKSSFGRLMISGPTFTTMASVSLWLGVLPDDQEISEVQSAWHSVATELEMVVVLSYSQASLEEGVLPRSV